MKVCPCSISRVNLFSHNNRVNIDLITLINSFLNYQQSHNLTALIFTYIDSFLNLQSSLADLFFKLIPIVVVSDFVICYVSNSSWFQVVSYCLSERIYNMDTIDYIRSHNQMETTLSY